MFVFVGDRGGKREGVEEVVLRKTGRPEVGGGGGAKTRRVKGHGTPASVRW